MLRSAGQAHTTSAARTASTQTRGQGQNTRKKRSQSSFAWPVNELNDKVRTEKTEKKKERKKRKKVRKTERKKERQKINDRNEKKET
jgi:hypothetical protein